MRVLFAVNNDEISNAIKKKYQEKYKEVLSFKNVYYFNAIIKELQRDKSYDRIVISEDLEPFANNNYDTIDKFIFDRLDNISDEATDEDGNGKEIILICTDRRSKADEIFVKFFSLGIYNAMIGADRSIEEVCNLINRPRNKKEAKQYYRINVDKAEYQTENENDVSEVEIQNILAHYRRIGKDEDKYVESFNNIVSQYSDIQLKVIIKYLPVGVKAILEQRSPKYQELVMFDKSTRKKYAPLKAEEESKEKKVNVKLLKEQASKNKSSKPIVIPSKMSQNGVKKALKEELLEDLDDEQEEDVDIDKMVDEEIVEPAKTDNIEKGNIIEESKPKRGRGRPRKNATTASQPAVEVDAKEQHNAQKTDVLQADDDIDLFNMDTNNKEENREEEIDLFNLQEDEKDGDELDLFNLPGDEDDGDLFDSASADINKDDEGIGKVNEFTHEEQSDEYDVAYTTNQVMETGGNTSSAEDFSRLLTKEKKVVSFVGTTKNGTSFIVNNVAELLASMGIPTAILDMTQARNAYYIYTNNNEQLRQTAMQSIPKLKNGIAEGIKVNSNLSVYTSLPVNQGDYSDATEVVSTLLKKHSVVLIDCDFNTPEDYFDKAQEIYLVQSMDVLTIQPLTAFLRDLKAKKILKPEKIKIVINKEQKIKNLSVKTLIGGIAFYNDPTMSYMTELFNRDKVQYCTIPFEMQNYAKYLNSLVECSVSLNGYTKNFIQALKELVNMIYPLIGRQKYSPRGDRYKETFSGETSDTLSKMKKKYQ